ncbi:hypothetical protein GALL_102420 [mine drainage metagenome]|uniref:Uncharacterized protein n=1 Tax=mine drainage metagenome TaxID=410659 RepID=A0A1J5T156_9ZZZZ
MKNTFSKNISTKLTGLGIYQIAGGIFGIALTFWITATPEKIPSFLFSLFLVPITLYSYSIYCGILLIKQKINGLNYSSVNQYLQLINFSILGYAFKYVSGVYLFAGIDMTHAVDFAFNFGPSNWQITINMDKEIILLNFNFVAFFLIIFIDKLKERIKKEED